jgi:hypothetical protein
MSSNFKTVLIEPSIISDITDQEVFGVQSGPAQSTYQQFSANSESNSSVIFNCQIPSENIVIDRHVLMRSNLTFTINTYTISSADSAALADKLVYNYGTTDSLQSFPLNKLFNTTQLTINNTSVSTNTKDVIDALIIMNDKRVMNKYNSMTPSLRDDAYGVYSDAVGSNNNPLASYNNASYDPDYLPRGAYNLDSLTFTKYIAGVAQTGGDNTLVITDESGTPGNTQKWSIVLSVTVTEPFIGLSPFTNCSDNKAGLIGVNNLTLNLNIGNANRCFSTVSSFPKAGQNGSFIESINLGTVANPTGIQNSLLLFNFLSLQPETYGKISSKNVLPYLDFPRYLSNNTQNTLVQSLTTQTLTSQTIQLNQVPDLILIMARVPMSAQNWTNTASFLAVKSIQVSFNNASGLLASATQQDLYEISSANSGNAQSWYEWSGQAQCNAIPPTGLVSGVPVTIPTTGSLLVLNPAQNFSLPSYLSASSLGSYQFQFNLTVFNQFPEDINVELCIITMNSGLFCTQMGTSSIYTGILNKELVLRTKEEKPVADLDTVTYERLVGGRLHNRGMGNVLKHIKTHRGGGMSGFGMSGFGMSGFGVKEHVKSMHPHIGTVRSNHPRLSKHLL